MKWHVIARVTDIEESQVCGFNIEGRPVALYRIGGVFYATSDICTHAFALLSEGYLEGDCIECPVHQAIFHVPTGQSRSRLTKKALQTYRVKIAQADVWVELPE